METNNFKTRKVIIDYLINEYACSIINNNYPNKVHFLKQKLNCTCTDCGGMNSIGDCNLETNYYKKIN